MGPAEAERLRRWRLMLGGEGDAEGTGAELEGEDLGRDRALEALYGERDAGLGSSSPRVARWLGDVRQHFPTSVVQVMQQDAVDRLGLDRLLLEPELLEAVEPDVHLVGTLLSLRGALPERSRQTAREVVRRVTDELERRLSRGLRESLTGALDRSARTRRPRRAAEIDWNSTIKANLRHYQPDLGTVVPESLIGHGRRSRAVERDVILALDQSGSMASSVVYAGVFAAVMASVRSLRTQVVAFDTEIADLTEHMDDPVELLFGLQLGGGTDINRALAYCQSLVRQPNDTILVLISDLYEGGIREEMLRRAGSLVGSGVQMVALLALSDDGAPSYDRDHAAALAGLGIPAFACTPDQFPGLMAAAIERRDLGQWAGEHDLARRRREISE